MKVADPGQVGLVGQRQHVEHQLGVLLERGGHAGGPGHDRQFAWRSAPRPSGCAARRHARHRGIRRAWIGRAARAVRPSRATSATSASRMLWSSLMPGEPAGAVAAVAVAEQPLENHARVDLHRQRRGRAAPRDRVRVGAAVAGVARPEHLGVFHGHLERADLGFLAQRARRDLIHRDAGPDVGPFRLLHVHAGQEGRGGARVIAGAFIRQRHRRACRRGRSGRAPDRGTARAAAASATTRSRVPSAAGVHRSMITPFGT